MFFQFVRFVLDEGLVLLYGINQRKLLLPLTIACDDLYGLDMSIIANVSTWLWSCWCFRLI
jgi:hypothetical protein